MAAAKPLRTAYLIGLLLAGSLALAACGKGGKAETPPERGDQAVAVVDKQTVWASDVKREAVTQGLIGEGEPLEVSSDLFHRVLDQVIDQKLLAAEALKRKLDKDPVAQRRLAAARERILGGILVESVVADAVNENAIRGLYQEQLKLAKRAEEIHARQIVVPTLAEAEAVKKMLASGAAFEAVAMEKSTDAATRFNGGDMGYFATDVMPGAYAQALKAAKPGQLIGPVAIDGNYALIKVEDRRLEPPLTFEAARPQIVRFLTYDQIRDLLEKLRGRSKINRLLGDGTNPPVPPADAPKTDPKAAPQPAPPPPAKGTHP